MSNDGKKKSLISKLKSSPAAKQLKEEGPMKVARTLGSMAKEGLGELSDKVMDTLIPLDNTHQQTRQGHFNQGAGEHIYVREDDNERFDRFTDRGVGLGSVGNVSSILNGVAIRGKKAANKPEGY